MEFSVLDSFYGKNEITIDIEYQNAIKNPKLKGGDHDKLLIVILDQFISHPILFSHDETKILSSLIKIRLSREYVKFKSIYPTLRELIINSDSDTREEDNTIINSLFPSEVEIVTNLKNVMIESFSSPSFEERYVQEPGPPIHFL